MFFSLIIFGTVVAHITPITLFTFDFYITEYIIYIYITILYLLSMKYIYTSQPEIQGASRPFFRLLVPSSI